MSHDATRMLLGVVQSSDRVITAENGDPASFPAGRAIRRTSTEGGISLASTAGSLIGVSMGISLSDTKKTAVCRVGRRVPIELAKYLVKAQLTFIAKRTPVINIALVAGGTAGSEVVTVTGDDVAGYLISVSMQTTVSTTTQIKAALDAKAEALALIETQIASGQGATAVTAFVSDEIDSQAQAVVGAAVRVSDTTGKAILAGGSLTGAVYEQGALDGLDPITGTVLFKVAPIDMGGGL